MPELTAAVAVAAESRLPLEARSRRGTRRLGRDPIASRVPELGGREHHVVVVEHRPRLLMIRLG